ncbi:hypothetical protein ACKWTF_006690 [Chironomus riparius]
MTFLREFIIFLTSLVILRVTSMPVNEINKHFTTQRSELSSFEYESVDDLNRLPFSKPPNVDYIADFDDSVDFSVTEAANRAKVNRGDFHHLSHTL